MFQRLGERKKTGSHGGGPGLGEVFGGLRGGGVFVFEVFPHAQLDTEKWGGVRFARPALLGARAVFEQWGKVAFHHAWVQKAHEMRPRCAPAEWMEER
jgi:hypothetical protein